uniref:Uncharacterized protein n=1 Tax=Arundo donax TaxID=35708 RepID=A0A0A9DHP6_ARUDO
MPSRGPRLLKES